ncbi:MAG: hypothetical protein EP330_13880 [Deltaproteobacteria bacterium]|nr:MAG: hypothetical protein EP330_13880 [Deltaproteobacteria bacterium]
MRPRQPLTSAEVARTAAAGPGLDCDCATGGGRAAEATFTAWGQPGDIRTRDLPHGAWLSEVFTYDDLGRAVDYTYDSDGDGSPDRRVAWTYDEEVAWRVVVREFDTDDADGLYGMDGGFEHSETTLDEDDLLVGVQGSDFDPIVVEYSWGDGVEHTDIPTSTTPTGAATYAWDLVWTCEQ